MRVDNWAEIVKANDFAAHASASEGTILVKLTGTADLTVKSHLDSFLHEVHAEAQRRQAEVVTMDVGQLQFMNSSCLKSLVWWIVTVQELPSAGRYRIVFLSNPALRWQVRSLGSLACIASDIVTVRT
jgi:hypothetical protein